MLNTIKERKERKDEQARKDKAAREEELKQALAEKCAGIGDEYVSHQEDETQYTVVTINGKTLTVRKEEITIESP